MIIIIVNCAITLEETSEEVHKFTCILHSYNHDTMSIHQSSESFLDLEVRQLTAVFPMQAEPSMSIENQELIASQTSSARHGLHITV